MSDDNRDDTKTGATQGDAGQGYVTADQLNETLTSFRDGLFGMMRGELKKLQPSQPSEQTRSESKPETGKKQSDTPPQIQQMQAELEAMKLRTSFAELAADAGLSKEQRSRLEKSFMAEKPEDPASWLAEWTPVLGKTEAADQPVEKAEQMRKPTSTAPVPKGTDAGEASDSVLKWSKEDLRRDMEVKAPVPNDPFDIRNKPYYQELRKRVHAQLAKTRVYIGPEK